MEDEVGDHGDESGVDALRSIAHAITPLGAAGAMDADGGFVSSLTEAVMSVANALHRIADSIQDLADATRDANVSP